jgi:FkbM family methyltransferase
MPTYFSQFGQDRLLDEAIFRGLRGGVFVDVGAYDGVTFSNSLAFERNYGWSGLCIEPNPLAFPKLAAARTAPCLNVAISDDDGKSLPFLQVTGYGKMLSGLVGSRTPENQRRVDEHIAMHGGAQKTIDVLTRRLDQVLADRSITEIHYLSIDTEGNEASVLRTLDTKRTMAHIIGAECKTAELPSLAAILGPRYVFACIHFTDAFFVHRDSIFMPRIGNLRRRSMLQRALRPARRVARALGVRWGASQADAAGNRLYEAGPLALSA